MKKLLVDYLTMSFKYPDHFEKVLIDSLNLPTDEIELIKSHFGRSNCIYYDGISIHFDDDLVILEMSGKGCRTCEDLNPNFDWFFFINSFLSGRSSPRSVSNIYAVFSASVGLTFISLLVAGFIVVCHIISGSFSPSPFER